ncbi:hypothetical protein [Cellulomonas marina]|uniref:SAF domain-containing protein n=1 Tax=Cellulomonas marina TaxID=988821 RepID=A0A1I0V2S9_9CELL|nr:hypothetical protein [Cellulomonas marina]GIG28243.1 flagellar protein FlgA [Cellulomonas marina]SFA69856.1 hypothetical protein SAMN05421867_10170 [Cellulomonas marina]
MATTLERADLRPDGRPGTPSGALPAPVAVRLRRPGWRDPRLLVGIALVAGSVLLGSWVVRSAQATVPVLVARGTLVPGDVVAAADLAVEEVRLVDAARYVPAATGLPQDAVVVRVVGEGELVPAAAVVPGAVLDVRPVAVPTTTAPSADLVVGSTVDLWATPPVPVVGGAGTGMGTGMGTTGGDGGRARPVALATGLTVAEVTRGSGALAAATGTVVHVLVPTADLPAVLAALADGSTVDVVLVPGGTGDAVATTATGATTADGAASP